MPESDHAYIERNTIALVGNYSKDPLDRRYDNWLGHATPSEEIHESGLWNVNHVEENYDPAFLDRLNGGIEATSKVS